MINFIDCGRSEFITRTRGKKLYCFGAGKNLNQFINEKYGIPIKGVIDNYRCRDNTFLYAEGITLKLLSVDEFKKNYDGNSIVVITTYSFDEIIKQLDAIEELEGMECYIEAGIRCFAQEDRDINLVHRIAQICGQKRDGLSKGKMENAVGMANSGRYQIWECLGESGIAGGKAPRDVKDILEQIGYQAIDIHPYKESYGADSNNWSYERLISEWKNCYDMVSSESILFLQYPFCQRQEERNRILIRLKAEKAVRIITLVHDVESLRRIYLDSSFKQEFEFIVQISDVLIVHNIRMMEYFLSKGISKEKLINLDIFDYLCEKISSRKSFERSITIAGNLDETKSPYIKELEELEPLRIHLYGPGYGNVGVKKKGEKEDEGYILYHGIIPSDRLPWLLDRGFGLVWDGESLDTCSGPTGNYLKYNNPHKLSLYLAAGLPVIIWKEAAEAAFVEKYGVGITVNSLKEICRLLDVIDEENYSQYLEHVSAVSCRLRQGYYTKEAVRKAEETVIVQLSQL